MSARSLVLRTLALFCLASAAHGQVLFSDNFESGSFGTWTTPKGEIDGAMIVNGGINGSTKAALINGANGLVLGHGLDASATLSDWSLEFDFQLQVAPGVTGRFFNVHIGAGATGGSIATDATAAAINLRYQFDGEGNEGFDVFGGTWVPLRAGSANGSLGTISKGEWHHLKIDGFGWGTPNFTYAITLTLADNTVRTASGLKVFQNGSPSSFKMDGFNFNRSFGFTDGVNFGVDNVVLTAVPEPSAIASLLLGASLLGFRRQRIA